MNKMHTKKRLIAGTSLVEVLVTVVILATGLLGLAALQSRSINYNQIAYLNTMANMVAYDMLDRIIANPVFAISGAGYAATVGNIPVVYNRDCDTANCTPTELAEYDIEQWKFLVDLRLPDGDGSITRADTPEGRTYTITVFFDDSKGRGTRRQVQLRATL